MPGEVDRTLVFCTAWSPDQPGHTRYWDTRYRRWLDAIRQSGLRYQGILIVDDGSAVLPDWTDVSIVREGGTFAAANAATLFSFKQRLGRLAVSNFPGWVRSFCFAALFAKRFGYEKVVHIESDAFIISDRMQRYINELTEGWTAFWCPLWNRPESGIQVIAGSAMDTYLDLAGEPIDQLATSVIENTLPFTHVERDFIGDRYGELQREVPRHADFSMQTFPGLWSSNRNFYWWMPREKQVANLSPCDALAQHTMDVAAPFQHAGLNYLTVFEKLSEWLRPRLYFEIGSKNGHSMAKFDCDSICVDPNLQFDQGVVGRRKKTFLFQMPSDEFFAQERIFDYLPSMPDIGFLDGLHLSEFLLRDFMNFEKNSHPKSVAILHDCLPFNSRMAERDLRRGGDDEPEAQRDYWTGDVWKVLVALKRFRPDLRVFTLDCPPTGLVIITGLDRNNRVLDTSYNEVIAEFSSLDLDTYTIQNVWKLFPMVNSARLFESAADTKAILGLEGDA